MKCFELRGISRNFLQQKINYLKRRVFVLKFQYKSKNKVNIHLIENMKKNIARIKTVLKKRG